MIPIWGLGLILNIALRPCRWMMAYVDVALETLGSAVAGCGTASSRLSIGVAAAWLETTSPSGLKIDHKQSHAGRVGPKFMAIIAMTYRKSVGVCIEGSRLRTAQRDKKSLLEEASALKNLMPEHVDASSGPRVTSANILRVDAPANGSLDPLPYLTKNSGLSFSVTSYTSQMCWHICGGSSYSVLFQDLLESARKG